MKKQVTWTLKSGAEATYTVELVLEEEINLDGDRFTVPCCEIRASFDIPGVGYIPGGMIIQKSGTVNGVDYVAIAGNKVALTADVYAAIKAANAEIKAHPAWIEKEETVKRNLRENREMDKRRARNGLCPKCGTYCYGDCEAN